MARVARVMVAGWPFHITHRGNHRLRVFFSDGDRLEYLRLLRHYATRFEMAVWAYCLMENHVHLIAVGRRIDSISRAIGNTHRAYSYRRHRERQMTGHLWGNRFFSTALDTPHLWAAVRYVELNPVRAGLTRGAIAFEWSSARAHAGQVVDRLLAPNRPFPGPIACWSTWLGSGLEEQTESLLRRNTSTGMPTGSCRFIAEIEKRLGRNLRRRARATRDTGRPRDAG